MMNAGEMTVRRLGAVKGCFARSICSVSDNATGACLEYGSCDFVFVATELDCANRRELDMNQWLLF
jgi:hypothetical protein